ncbi:hypothetical protein [Lysobacter enzymogenes]|uniref:hypothetical protein n=1 Tax=Lysobacter enzymogenes TaxID=69 RepID=UPI00111675BD|nr:hypothetical protein [Lysobacter enzymogenes]UZW62352.1 hypothetical protein BV903_008720 [Lysobacter enzymogenes]
MADKRKTVQVPERLRVSLSTSQRCAQFFVDPTNAVGDLLDFASNVANASGAIIEAYALLERDVIDAQGTYLSDRVMDALAIHASLLAGIAGACAPAVGGVMVGEGSRDD